MTSGAEGPFKLAVFAADKERTYYETMTVDHWSDAFFVHIKPRQHLTTDQLDEFVAGFNDFADERPYRPIIMVGDHFDVEIYVIGEPKQNNVDQLELPLWQ